MLTQFLRQHRIGSLHRNLVTLPIIAFPLLLCALIFASTQTPLSPWALIVASILSGFSGSLLIGVVGGGFAQYPRKLAIMATCLSSSLGAIIALITNATPFVATLTLTALFIPASSIAFRIARLYPPPEERDDRLRALEAAKSYRNILGFALLYSIIFGLACSSGLDRADSAGQASPFLIGSCFPGLILLLIVRMSRARIDLEQLQQLLVVLALLWVALLLTKSEALWGVGMMLLTATYTTFLLSNYILVYEIITENQAPAISTFALCQLFTMGGIVLGWTIGLAFAAQGFPA